MSKLLDSTILVTIRDWVKLFVTTTVPLWARASNKPSYTLDEIPDGTTRVLGGGSSSGGGNTPLWVEFTESNSTITCDTSVADIVSAVEAGRCVYGIINSDGNLIYELYYYTDAPLCAFSFSIRVLGVMVTSAITGSVDNNIDAWSNTVSSVPCLDSNNKIDSSCVVKSTGVAPSYNDRLLIVDSSNSDAVASTSLSFDGVTDTKALTQKGTWETFYKKPPTGIPPSDLASGVIPAAVTESTVSGWGFTKNTGNVSSSDITSIVKMTQAAYDLLATPDANTLYIITAS